MKFEQALFIAASLLSSTKAAQNEPPAGKVFISAWLDTADSSAGAKDGDRPVKFNRRMGFKASMFQYAQDLPIPSGNFPFPDDQIDATNSNAVAFLTVYPTPSPWTVADADIEALAAQCARITNEAKRRLILRLAPEMNGDWNVYGQQPINYVALWKRVYTAVKAKAPKTDFVWSPSSGAGYPFGMKGNTSADDRVLMDTNKDGVVDDKDDPYTPFYPGDEYVDWVGMSIYTYGTAYPWSDNIIAPAGKFEGYLNQADFYQAYSVQKKKPMMISEAGAAFHTNTPLGPGVGELATKQSWWQQYLTNSTFLDTYTSIKGINLFEFQKFEEVFANGQPSLRDFRISNKTEIISAFVKDFEPVSKYYVFGTGDGETPTINGKPVGNSGSRMATETLVAVILSAVFYSFFM